MLMFTCLHSHPSRSVRRQRLTENGLIGQREREREERPEDRMISARKHPFGLLGQCKPQMAALEIRKEINQAIDYSNLAFITAEWSPQVVTNQTSPTFKVECIHVFTRESFTLFPMRHYVIQILINVTSSLEVSLVPGKPVTFVTKQPEKMLSSPSVSCDLRLISPLYYSVACGSIILMTIMVMMAGTKLTFDFVSTSCRLLPKLQFDWIALLSPSVYLFK